MIKKFFKDSALYTLANLFTKGIAFVMLPIYLSYLSKEEYGVLDYITTVGMVVAVVITLEVAQAVIRFVAAAQDDINIKSKYISASLTFCVFTYALLVFVGHLNLEWISEFLTENKQDSEIASLAIISYFAFSIMYFTTVIYRSNLNAKSATLSSAIAAAITSLVTLILLSYFDMGLTGVLLGIIIGQFSVAFYNLFLLRKFWFVKPEFSTLIEMLRFSTPLVVSSLGVIFATFADRFMIKEMLSLSDLGEYSLAARLSTGVVLLTIGFQSALAPLIYSRLEDPNTPKSLRKLVSYYLVAAIVFIATSFLLASPVISLLTTEDYAKAPDVLVILVTSVLVSSGYLFFPGLSIAKKTHILAGINIFTGVGNLILNVLLISKFGIFGAAYATLISAIISLILNMYFSEKYFPILRKQSN
ncbi:hypothetical protein C1E24_20145 [Pseudoalteromonas phenolica]|uniref:Uncharacterized protein n=1 Tax=Pseudoalteromonas phenolica TaxID=161398 RepID=A0A5R9PWA4_9GAMM|nr:oligosaccharide flippase family protein [Pseudoalteromonas phenolica]TLX45198.1 hypothetical protein C1E24_20145 [Pseudoalteromonas phenolica]